MPEHHSRLFRSKTLVYTDSLWAGQTVTPGLWSLLNQRDRLIEITSGGPHWQVVLGAPHHAAPGVDGIAADWRDPRTGDLGRAADEMVGLLALAAFTCLQQQGISCKLVIAAHPTDHDPNKTAGCPYWDNLLSTPQPALIFELHGAAKRRWYDLELSAGKNRLARPLWMGRQIARRLPVPLVLAAQAEPGVKHGFLLAGLQETECRLQNPALRTTLLEAAGQAGIPALHLEAKRIFRQPDPGFPDDPRPTAAAWDLARALAAACTEELRSNHKE